YGTALMWTLLLLVPVLYVNQEMVLRLGVVSGVGHARLILERFGKFWGAFSVIDLFLLNALTIVTEFIGISLALKFLGLPNLAGVAISAVLVMLAASTGSFRRFERFAVTLSLGSLLLVPILFYVHAPVARSLHDFFIPGFPKGGNVGDVMLLIVAIVGTTVAPWQLFFQQSYVIDKRITPRFLNYERWDLIVGIGFVMLGAIAMMSFTAQAFAGRPEFGNFQDAGAVAAGLALYAGKVPGVLFAVGLLDASILGAAAVSLSTAYAVGDVLSFRHSLHRKVTDAPVFYAVYLGLIAVAAAVVLVPGSPLGLLTNAVQTLAGVLLPSATVFLLLLSNDKPVLGPFANKQGTNVFTGVVIAVLVVLSLILVSAVLFPSMGMKQVLWILLSGSALTLAGAAWIAIVKPQSEGEHGPGSADPTTWRMPPLDELPRAQLTPLSRVCLVGLRGYLIVAVVLVVVRVGEMVVRKG
ncbi:MAG: divalent metal cation transporter, partial [Candidatus Eremiobacteraeota bacterium]|nr:divalent metal cation transporter [Candidatus Eremiobacteraeota bacterium]